MIRAQQAQLTALQNQQNYTPASSSAALDDHTPPSERSSSYPYPAAPNPATAPLPIAHPRPRSPNAHPSLSLSRQSSRRSRTPSRTASPALRPVSAGLQAQSEGWFGERSSMMDDGAFYQAETQMLTRENQMLRARIRELGTCFSASVGPCPNIKTERQLSELSPTSINSPPISSSLAAPPVEAEQDSTEPTTGNRSNQLEEKED